MITCRRRCCPGCTGAFLPWRWLLATPGGCCAGPGPGRPHPGAGRAVRSTRTALLVVVGLATRAARGVLVEAALLIGLLGFIGTVVFARYVLHGDIAS
jgi:hypothetical protein